MTLLEFMRARVAEDRAAAQAGTRGRWKLGGLDPEEAADAYWLQPADQVHLWRWYPDRVLAECEALDEILDAYQAALEADLTPDATIESSVTADALELVVRILAQPHNGHPDYQEAWRPDVPTLTESRTT